MKYFLCLIDIVLSPIVLSSTFISWVVRKLGLQRYYLTRKIFRTVGIYPIRKHYYDPLFTTENLSEKWMERLLPGVDLNTKEQLKILSHFKYQDELITIPREKPEHVHYYYNNPAFGPGDGEYLYSLIRSEKPKKIIEVGSGYSTLMARLAIEKSKNENSDYDCEHICIEPYEMSWLERLPVKVIRKTVETIDSEMFKGLQKGDILFIDSSHMIRPGSDVTDEYLRILPLIAPGVFVHIHDIFSPRDYPASWLEDNFLLWNEQYLLEAFLTMNSSYKVIGALNYLKHNYPQELYRALPVLSKDPSREPGSFWMRRV